MGFIDDLVAELLSSLFSTVFTFAVGMPFLGVLVRYRANYTPHRLQLPDDDQTPPADEVVTSYLGVMRRVYRVEGWAGFYKGLVPAVLTTMLTPLAQMPFKMILSLFDAPRGGETLSYIVVVYTILWICVFPLLAVLLLLPMQILTYRAITTQHHLPFFARSPKPAFNALLSTLERQKPYLLYLTPGLALSNILLSLTAVLGGLPVQMLVMLMVDPRGREETAERLKRHLPFIILAGVVAFIILLLLLTPLRLMRVRLALQRREAAEATKPAADIPDAPLMLSEPVINLRTAPDHGDAEQLPVCLAARLFPGHRRRGGPRRLVARVVDRGIAVAYVPYGGQYGAGAVVHCAVVVELGEDARETT
ncbi:hypothetical protein MIND_00573000 [Mycena indigotica]|uniref:Uncharacterized protein n=1 Tax=Mycena indigotica TaxID=2126181 RepID=A0A8H6SR88_9AGAR|nr:uncharacterized protein MIND_00573000 [Mycena indigotica]KAF7303442.1 hypothetical protein MIND_00573000 [Mycena indigotica]